MAIKISLVKNKHNGLAQALMGQEGWAGK